MGFGTAAKVPFTMRTSMNTVPLAKKDFIC
jgi:hypothetical protein